MTLREKFDKRSKFGKYWLYKKLARFFYRAGEAKYYFVCWIWRKHNKLKIRSLPPTFRDRDVVLEHAVFQILTDFYEREEPWGAGKSIEEIVKTDLESCFFTDFSRRPETERAWIQAENKRELWEIYLWWANYTNLTENEEIDLDDFAEVLDKNLKRVVELRGYLWT